MKIMKSMQQKTLLCIALLTGILAIVACEEEADLKNQQQLSSIPIGKNENSTATISNGFLKEQLIQRALEAYATLYDVNLTSKNTKVIEKGALQAWVKANEKNKHKSINQKNQAALAEISSQGDVYALQVTAPTGAKFTKSVFVYGRLASIIITDITDILTPPNWRVVKESVGFYGDGVLTPWGDHPCGCVEQNVIIFGDETVPHCGKCPDIDDL